MGSYLEVIKNVEEIKEIIIFDEQSLCQDTEIGDNFSDFEIIRFFDFKGDQNNYEWSLAEVRSLKNKKRYILQKLYQRPELYEQIKRVKDLNNPYIIKYYKSFKDDYNIYIIMEFIDSDIDNWIQANKIYNTTLNEEDIWNILLQCSLGLIFLHKQNLANLGFKFRNVYMNDEQNIKIGVFKAWDNNKSNYYNIKDNILTLGNFFIQEENEQKIYSKELLEIIKLMTENDLNKRPDVNTLYNMIRSTFIKNYARNTSILAVLRCLYSYSNLNENIFKKENIINQNKIKNDISYWYLKIISNFFGIKNENINELIEDFRLEICSKYNKFGENKEINPFYLLIMILVSMYKESNIINQNNEPEQKIDKQIINSVFDPEKLDKLNKGQMFDKFIENYKKNANSPISDLFCGIMMTEIICQKCDNINYSFSNFCFIYYDISNRNNDKKFDLIKDGFENNELLCNEKNIYCEKCLTYQNHKEINKYYKMCHQLIIYFNRGHNYKNNSQIIFNDNLNLIKYIEDKINSPKDFYLVGSINRIINKGKEEFIYYAREPNNNNFWNISHENNCLNLNESPINQIQSNGQIILLFYNNKEKNVKINN